MLMFGLKVLSQVKAKAKAKVESLCCVPWEGTTYYQSTSTVCNLGLPWLRLLMFWPHYILS